MITDAATLSDGEVLQADVCIAGAGAAGMTLGMALMGWGLRVVVLEGGGEDYEASSSALYRGDLVGLASTPLDRSRLRLLGGTTGHWAGWCKPLRPSDLEARAWIPHSGWPLSYDALEPWYRAALEVLELGSWSFDAAEVAAREELPLLTAAGGALTTEMYQYSPPTRFGTRYRANFAESEEAELFLHANLVNIVLSGDDRVSRFEGATLQGNTFVVEADRYVLALGGIENARVLLASNSQRPDGVANGRGWVGRCFMEHPHYRRSAAIVAPAPLDLDFYVAHEASLPREGGPELVPVRGVLTLSDAVRREERLLGWNLHLIEVDAAGEGEDLGPLAADTVRALSRPDGGGALYRAYLRTEQTPLPESRITLGDARDALGMPRVQLDWRVRPDDQVALQRAMEIVGAELASLGLGRLWTPQSDGIFDWSLTDGGHHMGTTRMAAEAAAGVVDADLRCFEVPNLYILGSSTFVTGGDSNPTMTLVALAERLGAHLRDAP